MRGSHMRLQKSYSIENLSQEELCAIFASVSAQIDLGPEGMSPGQMVALHSVKDRIMVMVGAVVGPDGRLVPRPPAHSLN